MSDWMIMFLFNELNRLTQHFRAVHTPVKIFKTILHPLRTAFRLHPKFSNIWNPASFSLGGGLDRCRGLSVLKCFFADSHFFFLVCVAVCVFILLWFPTADIIAESSVGRVLFENLMICDLLCSRISGKILKLDVFPQTWDHVTTERVQQNP